jgi:hypothetical protein
MLASSFNTAEGGAGDDGDDTASVATFKTTPSIVNAYSAMAAPWEEMQIVPLGLGNYSEVELLGQGTFGKVYLVTDEARKRFALKKKRSHWQTLATRFPQSPPGCGPRSPFAQDDGLGM